MSGPPRAPRVWVPPRSSTLDTSGSLLLAWRQPQASTSPSAGSSAGFSGWLSFAVVLLVEYVLAHALLGTLTASVLVKLFLPSALWEGAVAVTILGVAFVALTWAPWAAVVRLGSHQHSLLIRIALICTNVLSVALLLIMPIAFVRSYAYEWPFLQRLAIEIEGVVLAMKAHSYHRECAALARDVRSGGAGCGDTVKLLRAAEPCAPPPAASEPSPAGARDASAEGLSPPSLKLRQRRRGSSPSPIEAAVTSLPSAAVAAAEASSSDDSGGLWPEAPRPSALRGSTSEGRAWSISEIPFPRTVTLKDSIRFLIAPTLVYDSNVATLDEQPSLVRIAEKVLLAVGLVVAGVIISSSIDWAAVAAASFVDAVALLCVPITLLNVIAFATCFECCLNVCGELTRSAERHFYSSWWDSTTFAEFSRAWNAPVHCWLHRHVYTVLRAVSHNTALAATFALSIAAHEFIIWGALGARRKNTYIPWLALLSAVQLPLYSAMRHKILKGTRLGNFVFWSGLTCGMSAVCALYVRQQRG